MRHPGLKPTQIAYYLALDAQLRYDYASRNANMAASLALVNASRGLADAHGCSAAAANTAATCARACRSMMMRLVNAMIKEHPLDASENDLESMKHWDKILLHEHGMSSSSFSFGPVPTLVLEEEVHVERAVKEPAKKEGPAIDATLQEMKETADKLNKTQETAAKQLKEIKVIHESMCIASDKKNEEYEQQLSKLENVQGQVIKTFWLLKEADETRIQVDEERAIVDKVRAKADEVRAKADKVRAKADEVRAKADEVRAKADTDRAAADVTRDRNDLTRTQTDKEREQQDLSRETQDADRTEQDAARAERDAARAEQDAARAKSHLADVLGRRQRADDLLSKIERVEKIGNQQQQFLQSMKEYNVSDAEILYRLETAEFQANKNHRERSKRLFTLMVRMEKAAAELMEEREKEKEAGQKKQSEKATTAPVFTAFAQALDRLTSVCETLAKNTETIASRMDQINQVQEQTKQKIRQLQQAGFEQRAGLAISDCTAAAEELESREQIALAEQMRQTAEKIKTI